MSQSRQLTVPFPSSDTYRDRERERRGMGTLRLTFFLQLSDYGVLSSVHGPRKADIQAMITCFFKHNHRVMTAHCVLSITWHYPSLGYLPKASLYTKPVLPCKMGQGAAEKEISYKKKHLINKPCSSFPCLLWHRSTAYFHLFSRRVKQAFNTGCASNVCNGMNW